MKLDRFACDECTLTYWVPGDSGYLVLMCPRCTHENPLVRCDSFEQPYGVPMLVAEVNTGAGAKRPKQPRATPAMRKPPKRTPAPVTMALRLGGSL